MDEIGPGLAAGLRFRRPDTGIATLPFFLPPPHAPGLKRLLMIAFHFPPLAGSSGIQRTLRFVQHLPALGWQPLVLSADARAYPQTSQDLIAEIPPQTVVRRAFALDTARHLTLGGRYFGWMARPDRWVSWQFAAVREGLRLIKAFEPDAIWSTYPIATAHRIGAELQRRSGLPWIADFRDPMAQDGYPPDPKVWQRFKRVEERAIAQARLCVFTTPSAARLYQERYPEAAKRIVVLENGYDEDSFAGVAAAPSPAPPSSVPTAQSAGESPRPLVLLHSGIVYPSERDPTQLFEALGRLASSGALTPADLRLRFRASVHDDLLKQLALAHGAPAFLELCPAIGYREALAEMLSVDALLVLQAANCNEQIPAKIYEYLRAGRPILALTDPAGDTAGVLRGAGLDAIARLDSVDEIAEALPRFVQAVRAGRATLPEAVAMRQASRKARSESFAEMLNALK